MRTSFILSLPLPPSTPPQLRNHLLELERQGQGYGDVTQYCGPDERLITRFYRRFWTHIHHKWVPVFFFRLSLSLSVCVCVSTFLVACFRCVNLHEPVLECL